MASSEMCLPLCNGGALQSAAAPEQFLAGHYRALGSQKNDFRNANLHQLIASLVAGDAVLDIGCGSGALLSLLAQRGKTVVGMEPSRDLIRLAKRLHSDVEVHEGHGDDIERLGRQFDAVTIIDVLEHIEDDRAQLRHIYNVLRPGGQLVVLVPAFQFLYGRRDASNGHFRRYSRRELVEKLNATGFFVRGSRFWNALGVAPYWVSERLLRRELRCEMRSDQPQNWLNRTLGRALYAWFAGVENRISFGCGLSLICVAQKPLGTDESLRRAA